MANPVIFILIIVILQLLFLNVELLKNNEEPLCITTDVLCVKDVIIKIVKAEKNVAAVADGIEQSIRRKERNEHSLQQNINRIRKRILSSSNFPTSKFHDQFDELNNIVRSDLIHLMIEEHDAVSYLYYSIDNLLHQSFFDHEYDSLFDGILQNFQHNMLCNYRNILRVYSENWQPASPVNSIQLLQTTKRDISSSDYRAYSIIILELLRQWMEKIDNVLNNLENKII